MQSPYIFRVSRSNTPFHILCVVMIAVLLAGAAFAAQPAGKVLAAGSTCTSVTANPLVFVDWNTAASWSCDTGLPNRIPSTGDDVVINADMVISTTPTDAVLSVTINPTSTLQIDTAGVVLTLNGDFDVQGIFDDHAGGTVEFGAGSQTIKTNGSIVDFSNLTKIASGAGETLSVDPCTSDLLTCAGELNVSELLSLQGANPNNLMLRSAQLGLQWSLQSDGSRAIDFVDVQDSANLSNPIIVSHGKDSGNTSGWVFLGLASSKNPSLLEEAVIFTATLPPGASDTTLAFKYGILPILVCASQPVTTVLDADDLPIYKVATCSTGNLAAGSHVISVEPSSGTLSLTQDVVVFSLISVNSSANPVLLNGSVTFTAQVTPLTITSGTVAFKDGGVIIGGCDAKTLSASATATCSVGSISPFGEHNITAEFIPPPGATVQNSVSAPFVQVVKAATTVGVLADKDTTSVGEPVTLTATVASGTAGGLMTFMDGTAYIPGCQFQAVDTGVATCKTRGLNVNDHIITVVYNGDATHMGSTSPEITQHVVNALFYLPILRK